MLDGDALLDLLKLGANPGVIDVALGVQASESLETLIDVTLVDEPTGGLGEEEDQGGEDDGGETLETEGDTPLARVVVLEADVCAWGC